MSDPVIFAFGTFVSGIFVAGVYTALRIQWEYMAKENEAQAAAEDEKRKNSKLA